MTPRDPKTSGRGPRPSELGPLLDRVLSGRGGLSARHRRIDELRRAWVEAAGPEVAGHTRVRSFARGEVVVDVDSGPLCHRLASFDRDRLLVAIQARCRRATVTGLRFRLGAFD